MRSILTMMIVFLAAGTGTVWAVDSERMRLPVSEAERVCQVDSDCVTVSDHCGDCTCGDAINAAHQDGYEERLRARCEQLSERVMCDMACPPQAPVCSNGRCILAPLSPSREDAGTGGAVPVMPPRTNGGNVLKRSGEPVAIGGQRPSGIPIEIPGSLRECQESSECREVANICGRCDCGDAISREAFAQYNALRARTCGASAAIGCVAGCPGKRPECVDGTCQLVEVPGGM